MVAQNKGSRTSLCCSELQTPSVSRRYKKGLLHTCSPWIQSGPATPPLEALVLHSTQQSG